MGGRIHYRFNGSLGLGGGIGDLVGLWVEWRLGRISGASGWKGIGNLGSQRRDLVGPCGELELRRLSGAAGWEGLGDIVGFLGQVHSGILVTGLF